jgi:hypothetical protein
MYYKLNSDEYELLNRIQNKTLSSYDIKEDLIPVENLISVIEDLVYELNNLEERYKDLEEDLETNYKPIPIDYGLSDRDFI